MTNAQAITVIKVAIFLLDVHAYVMNKEVLTVLVVLVIALIINDKLWQIKKEARKPK
jgi:hypothetical protein